MAAAGLNSFLNNQSLVVLFSWKGKNLLFAGDAQEETGVLALRHGQAREGAR